MSDKERKLLNTLRDVACGHYSPEEGTELILSDFAVECMAPASQPADLLQTIRYLLLSWSVFYAKLPDGEYDGLGEMRTALANIKDVEVILAATPQVTPELELEQEADGRWLAAYTRFPGVAAYGPSKEEAIRNAAKVLIESVSPKCRRCAEGNIPEWSKDAKCYIHRSPTLDRRCDNPTNPPCIQVPEETVSSPEHQAWLAERKKQDPLNPQPIFDVASEQASPSDDITPEEAKGLAKGLMDFAEGRTRPLSEIEKELAESDTRKDSGREETTVASSASRIEGTSEQVREFKPYMEDHEYYDPPQAPPTPDKCPTCGSKDYWTALPACHGGIPDSWHSSAPKGTQ